MTHKEFDLVAVAEEMIRETAKRAVAAVLSDMPYDAQDVAKVAIQTEVRRLLNEDEEIRAELRRVILALIQNVKVR